MICTKKFCRVLAAAAFFLALNNNLHHLLLVMMDYLIGSAETFCLISKVLHDLYNVIKICFFRYNVDTFEVFLNDRSD